MPGDPEGVSPDIPGGKNYLFENLSEDMAALMEEVRLGKKTLES